MLIRKIDVLEPPRWLEAEDEQLNTFLEKKISVLCVSNTSGEQITYDLRRNAAEINAAQIVVLTRIRDAIDKHLTKPV